MTDIDRLPSSPLPTAPPPDDPPSPDSAKTAAPPGTAAEIPWPVLAMGIEAPAPFEADRDTSAQRGLDAFRALASPTYHVPGEGDVTVAAPFRMPHAPQVASSTPVDAVTARYAATEARVVAHQPELRALATKLGVQDLYAVSIGHASPETVRRLTQGLIDAGRLPPSDGHTTTAVRVRTMMNDYGLGFDCAGYVQRAFLAARGLTRAQAGFASGTAVESLGDLPAKGFVKVPPESARPGDIVVLDAAPGGGPGHRLVVHDRREPSAAEVASLALRSNGVPLTPGRVSAIQVDSSFGSGGMPQVGGVGSRTWLYDAASQQWAPDTGGPLVFSSRPYYGDSLRGIYHFPGKL